MDRSILWRAALLQAILVAAVALVLGLLLAEEFFEDWGWLAGPAAWAVCALITARALQLAPLAVLLGAAVAGVPSVVAVIVGVHWLGAVVAIALFALWCGRLARERELPARVV